MGRNKKKQYAYRPSDKVISKISAISSILGAAGIIGYCLLIFGSFQKAGQGDVFYGLIGWMLFVMSAVGLFLAVRSFEDTAAMAVWKVTGCVFNSLVLLFSIVIFILGI